MYDELKIKLESAFQDTTAEEIAERLRPQMEAAYKRFAEEQKAMKPSRKQLQQPITI